MADAATYRTAVQGMTKQSVHLDKDIGLDEYIYQGHNLPNKQLHNNTAVSQSVNIINMTSVNVNVKCKC